MLALERPPAPDDSWHVLALDGVGDWTASYVQLLLTSDERAMRSACKI